MRYSAIRAMVNEQCVKDGKKLNGIEFLYSEASTVSGLDRTYTSRKEVYEVTIGDVYTYKTLLIEVNIADITK